MTTADLYPLLTPLLAGMARRRLNCPEDVEDTVQEVWRRMVQAKPAFDSAGHAMAWCKTTLLRLIADRYREHHETAELTEAARAGVDRYPLIECDEWLTRWCAVVGSLTERDKRIARLLALGYSYADGAAEMGMKAGNYRACVHRLREKLRGA